MSTLHILVVDDDRDHADALAEVLIEEGHHAITAYSGEAAVRLAAGQEFDLTFLDVKLPGINGLECYMEMRRARPHARIVMMTGYRVEQILAEAVEDGAVAVLRKPIAVEDVLAAVARALPEGIVLVAEDDPDLGAALKSYLEINGYRALVADSRDQVLREAGNRTFDVLLLDLKLPIVDGLEVYLQLKEIGRAMPTILITGPPVQQNDEDGRLTSMSVTGFLFKPFELADLLRIVRLAMEERPALLTGGVR